MEKIVVDIEFKTNVQKISKDLDSVKDSLAETNDNLDGIAKTGKSTDGALKKMSKGFKGMGLAMKTLGVGLIIEAFNFLKDVMMQNQSVMDGVAVVTETLGVVFNQVTSVVTDVFDAVSKSSEGFEGLQKVIGGLMTISVTPLKLAFYGITLAVQEGQLAWEQSFFGDGDPETIAQLNEKIVETKDNLKDVVTDVVDAGTTIAQNIGEAVTELGSVVTIATETATEGIKDISLAGALATGKALADAKKNEELLEVLRSKQQLQSQLEAELQRQVRDDISATFEERIKANEKLGKILEEQTEKEKVIADEKVRIAELELSTNKTSIELQTKYQQTLLEQIDIDERIAGLRSEQLTNEQSLIKEQAESINTLTLATMSAREQELESLKQDYNAKKLLAEQSGFDISEITKQYNQLVLDSNQKFAQEDLDIQKKLDDEKKAQQEANLDVLQNTIKMAGDLFEEGTAMSKVSGVASATIDTWKAVNMALASAPPPLSYVSAGLSLATGLKSIKNILAVKTKKSTGASQPTGDTSLPSGGATESLADLSGLPSITEQFNSQFGQEQPVQAYVVEQDVTSSQQINTMIQQKSTL